MRSYYWILLFIAALPLVVYPFILLANIMSLAGTKSSAPVPMMQWMIAKAFLWSSTLYPIVYIACLIAAIAASRSGDGDKALLFAASPLAYMGVCVVLMLAWMMT